MQITILRESNYVLIDGRALPVDCSDVEENIEVIHWSDERNQGHIEFVQGGGNFNRNGHLGAGDFQEYEYLRAAWFAEKFKVDNPPAQPINKTTLRSYAALVRWKKEVRGIVSPTYGPLYTDRETRAIIGQTVQSIDLGMLVEPFNFKVGGGFPSITRAMLIAIGTEIVTHVQACFDKEKDVDAAITAETITSYAQIEEAFA